MKEPCNNIIKSDACGINDSLYSFITVNKMYGHIFVHVIDRRNTFCKTWVFGVYFGLAFGKRTPRLESFKLMLSVFNIIDRH